MTMTDAQRLRLIGDTRRLLEQLEPVSTGICASRALLLRNAEARSGVRASGGGGGHAVGGHSDPTLAAVAPAVDRSAKVRAQLDQDDADLIRAADLIAAVATRSAVALRAPADPAPVQKPMTGCMSCARDGGHWTPIADGQYRDLCRRCGNYKGAEGRLPPLGAVQYANRTGRAWTTKVIADAMRAEVDGRTTRPKPTRSTTTGAVRT